MVSAEQIEVGENHVVVEFTPTVPHCGMSTLIGMVTPFRLTTHAGLPSLSLRVVHPSETVAQSSTEVQGRHPGKAWFPSERAGRCAVPRK